MCQHMADRKKAAKDAYDDLVTQQTINNDAKADAELVKGLLESLTGGLQAYGSALRYVGRCLTYVILNDEPFDKGECDRLANEIDSNVTALKSLIEQVQAIIDNIVAGEAALQASIDAAKATWDGIDASADCAACRDQKARAAAAAAAMSGTSSSTPTSPHSAVACFLKGTKVHATDGLINIENIKVGNKILSYNIKTKENEHSIVSATLIHDNIEDFVYEIKIGNNVIEVTGKHKFYIEKDNNYKWIKVEKLIEGNKVMFADNTLHEIEKIEKRPYKGKVYNIEVKNNHNYYVSEDGILVHNKR